MSHFDPIHSELKEVGRLAGPLIVGQLSQVGMGFTDTVMAGRLSAIDLAAVSMGSSLWIPIYLGCVGIMMAVSPTVAYLKGANQSHKIGPIYRQSLWIGVGLAIIGTLIGREIGIILPWLNINTDIIPLTQGYLIAISWGIPAVCAYLALRYVSEGIGHTKPVMYIQLIGLAINAVGDYILMYGKLGAPALGAIGTAWSSAIVYWIDAVLIVAYVKLHPHYRTLNLFHRIDKPDFAELWRLLRLGAPIATTITMEVGLFTAVTLLMGALGVVAVAAHQIALNYAALTFMVPLGISMAITIRVGQAAGAQNISAARFSGMIGMSMAVCAMAFSAGLILLIPENIASLYTQNPQIIQGAVHLLFMAALFQIFDGLQVSALGALRGLKDTSYPMWVTFIAYWSIGLPLSYLFGITQAFGPQGLWAGLIFGLTTAAILLSLRFHQLTKNTHRKTLKEHRS